MTVSKDQLLKPRIGEATVTIDGIGELHIRALTRAQALEVQKLHASDDVLGGENLLISLGVVRPALTADDVAAWAEAAPSGELQAVSVAIARVSGMTVDSGKEAYKSAGG